MCYLYVYVLPCHYVLNSMLVIVTYSRTTFYIRCCIFLKCKCQACNILTYNVDVKLVSFHIKCGCQPCKYMQHLYLSHVSSTYIIYIKEKRYNMCSNVVYSLVADQILFGYKLYANLMVYLRLLDEYPCIATRFYSDRQFIHKKSLQVINEK